MNNINGKITELDLSGLIKVLHSGIWIILTFTILGLFVGYIYQNSIIFSETGESKYVIKIPVYELGTVDKLKLNELNYRIQELYLVQHERSLLKFQPVSDNMLSQFDNLVSSRISGFIDLQNIDPFTEVNKITSRELMSMLFQITKKDTFIKNVIFQYNFSIKDKYSGDEEKIKKNLIDIRPNYPILDINIVEIQSVQRFELMLKFVNNQKFTKEMTNDLALQTLLFLRNELNKQLNERYNIAVENYYQAINYIQEDIKYLINQLENEFEHSLKSKISNLKDQKDIAISLGYDTPSLEFYSDNIGQTEDDFAKGYIYLDKRIAYYENKLNVDYSNFIPEIRFYKNAFLEIGKYITLEKTKKKISQLGLFNNEMKVFDTGLLYEPILYDNSVDSTLTVQQTAKTTLYTTPFGALIGLVFGIIITFLNFFYRNKYIQQT